MRRCPKDEVLTLDVKIDIVTDMIYPAYGKVVLGIVVVGLIGLTTEPADADEQDRAAIERLHQHDIAATLTDDADQLAKLWDEDAVRLQPDSPAEVGKATIYENDKRWQSNRKGGHTLSYKPEVKNLQITDGWAFEWGTFEVRYRVWQGGKEKTIRGTMLRVLKKQNDGSWKFTRVMAALDSRKT